MNPDKSEQLTESILQLVAHHSDCHSGTLKKA